MIGRKLIYHLYNVGLFQENVIMLLYLELVDNMPSAMPPLLNPCLITINKNHSFFKKTFSLLNFLFQMLVDVSPKMESKTSCCVVHSFLRLNSVSSSDSGLYTCRPGGLLCKEAKLALHVMEPPMSEERLPSIMASFANTLTYSFVLWFCILCH